MNELNIVNITRKQRPALLKKRRHLLTDLFPNIHMKRKRKLIITCINIFHWQLLIS